eukprot:SAG25_NODE_12024_length_289_cov_1.078947_1_plen_47_part_10
MSQSLRILDRLKDSQSYSSEKALFKANRRSVGSLRTVGQLASPQQQQ